MDKAVKSTAVVSSLFPEAVHSRLFADKSEEIEQSKEMIWKNDEPEKRASIKAFLVDGKKPTKNNKGRPIADKFEDVTVLFADLAGFTKWSSSREPEQVFELLETLYSAFDKIALRRQVFKVETIGDW
jgi:class 3 adenylate cyclase